ncbi:Sulfate adenylyltransferase [Symbiodinium microadriaticum]|uniref:Sulfate adenylyltransferase n=1 Tax=Symbiodinium microadriaticum TaxID=2951 RepID=A0A1Q9DRQ6_SYMMI|nr:Sulfate adenylyltransferase [Symbiodinium microadriaticum]
MRLPEKQLFGLPVTFDLPEVDGIKQGDKLLLKWKGADVAVLEVVEAKECYGTSSLEHPTVASLVQEIGKFYVGGKIHGFELPFGYPTQTPAEVRATLPENKQVELRLAEPVDLSVGYKYSMHQLRIATWKDVKDSVLLVHPTCGPTQPGDIDGIVRIQTYEALKAETAQEYPMFRWAYLPYSMKMAGPREAIQHMIIRKNYGATHFIIGRDMAGTKSTIDGEDFYGPYDAQETGKKYSAELGVTVYVGPDEGYVQESVAKSKGYKVVKLSGTEFRRRLRAGEDIPEVPGPLSGSLMVSGLALFGALFYMRPTRWVLQKTVLPAPGEGPSKETRDNGYFNLRAIAVGEKALESGAAPKVVAQVKSGTGGDPGYKCTALMSVEAALCCALQKDKCSAQGGVTTPAAGLGSVLVDRLNAAGMSLSVDAA